jgi:hypothetical protein
VLTIGLDDRLGVDAVREWPPPGFWGSKIAMSSDIGQVLSEPGSVEEREWNGPPKNPDLRALSGVPPR